jgi:hypothetical protein
MTEEQNQNIFWLRKRIKISFISPDFTLTQLQLLPAHFLFTSQMCEYCQTLSTIAFLLGLADWLWVQISWFSLPDKSTLFHLINVFVTHKQEQVLGSSSSVVMNLIKNISESFITPWKSLRKHTQQSELWYRNVQKATKILFHSYWVCHA